MSAPLAVPPVTDGRGPRYPVSIKGVVFVGKRAVLLKNERDEWELPGGHTLTLHGASRPILNCHPRAEARERHRPGDPWMDQTLTAKWIPGSPRLRRSARG